MPIDSHRREALVNFLKGELGQDAIDLTDPKVEPALRRLVHLILSTPEFQLG